MTSARAEDANDSAGKAILKINKEIKEKREAIDECEKKSAGKESADCKKMKEDLQKLRAQRDEELKGLKEGQALRRKMRRDIANDRKAEKREKSGGAAGSTEESPTDGQE